MVFNYGNERDQVNILTDPISLINNKPDEKLKKLSIRIPDYGGDKAPNLPGQAIKLLVTANEVIKLKRSLKIDTCTVHRLNFH